MRTEAGIKGLDQLSVSRMYVPNIFNLTESGRGGEIDFNTLSRTEQTSGATELADTVLRKVYKLQQDFSELIFFTNLNNS